jgi:hypothetical protein
MVINFVGRWNLFCRNELGHFLTQTPAWVAEVVGLMAPLSAIAAAR